MVRHASGVDLVLVPGGSFDMGMSETEAKVFVASARTEEGRAIARDIVRAARPRHRVRVAPFLCARDPLSKGGELLLVSAADAARIAKARGLRLLSESEWEWVARDGGARAWIGVDEADGDVWRRVERHARDLYGRVHPKAGRGRDRFGVFGLAFGDWVADAWHGDYRRAPVNGAVWGRPKTPGVLRGGTASHYPWQNDDEHLDGHAAVRTPAARGLYACVRLARDLPEGFSLPPLGPRRGLASRPLAKKATKQQTKATKSRAGASRKPADPRFVARIEELARARWSTPNAAEVRVRVSTFRSHVGSHEARVLVVVRARTRERAYGENARGPDREGALRALLAKLEK